jgi:septum formation protein
MNDSMNILPESPSALPLLPGLKGRKLVLASASPRRKQLMSMLGIPFEVRPLDVDEVYSPDLKGPDIPRFLSELKAKAGCKNLQANEILISSDTVVQLKGQTLGKPQSHAEAVDMILTLSGQTHQVVTAFCVVDGRTPNDLQTDHDSVDVSFLHLTREFADHYVKFHHPFDKAGGYGAQDLIGACAIHSLKGSHYTVMGLPMHKIFQKLQDLI